MRELVELLERVEKEVYRYTGRTRDLMLEKAMNELMFHLRVVVLLAKDRFPGRSESKELTDG